MKLLKHQPGASMHLFYSKNNTLNVQIYTVSQNAVLCFYSNISAHTQEGVSAQILYGSNTEALPHSPAPSLSITPESNQYFCLPLCLLNWLACSLCVCFVSH